MNEKCNSKNYKNKKFPPGPNEVIPYRLALKFISNPLPILIKIVNKYGNISHFKFGPRLHVYLINEPSVIEDILVKHNNNFTKSPGLRLAKRVIGSGLITSEGRMHEVQRRLVQPAFNRDKMETYQKIISDQSHQYLKSNWNNGLILDIHKEMTKLTLSIISKILFGSDILTISDISKISDSITIIIEYINKLRLPFLRFIEFLPIPMTKRYHRALSELDGYIYGKITERKREIELQFKSKSNPSSSENLDNLNQNQSYEDMLSILIKSIYHLNNENEDKEDRILKIVGERKMTDQQLRDEVMTIFLAGHETTANALTWTLYLLSLNPEAESKIMNEIKSFTGNRGMNDKEITFEDLSKLRYSEMVLMESMRLYPPSWAIGRQAIGDYVLNEKYTIPSGSVIIMSQYLVHHDSRYFSEPEKFLPERWSTEFRASIPRFSYFPFGGGPRACIGEPLAWMESLIVLVSILKNWRLTLEDDAKDIKLQPLVTLRPRLGIRMKLHKREF